MNLTRIIDIKERIAISPEWKPDERDFILECINRSRRRYRRPPREAALAHEAGHAVAVLHAPPNYLGRIDQIWAFLSLDDGGEGVVAAPLAGMTVPMIAADKNRLDSLIPLAKRLTKVFRKPIRLAKFTKREDVEIFQP